VTERDDFVDLIGGLTNYIQNERVRSYNEGVDMVLHSAREWLRLRGYSHDADNMPDLLNCLMNELDARDDAAGQPEGGGA
jgi:hypothetical protein